MIGCGEFLLKDQNSIFLFRKNQRTYATHWAALGDKSNRECNFIALKLIDLYNTISIQLSIFRSKGISIARKSRLVIENLSLNQGDMIKFPYFSINPFIIIFSLPLLFFPVGFLLLYDWITRKDISWIYSSILYDLVCNPKDLCSILHTLEALYQRLMPQGRDIREKGLNC